MTALFPPALLLFQDAASLATDVHGILICEIILTAIVVLLLLALGIAALVVYTKVNALLKQVDAKSQPLIAQATPLIGKGKEIAGHVNEILADLKPKIAAVSSDLQPRIQAISADLQPKIASISSDVQHISSVVRSKVDEAGQTLTRVNQTVQDYNATAQDVNAKAQGQVQRVNEMVSEALTATQHVSKQVQHGIRVPIEKIASWVTAAKTSIENLAGKLPFFKDEPITRPNPAATRAYRGPVPVETRIVRSAIDEDNGTPGGQGGSLK